jgi:hypothetical protein
MKNLLPFLFQTSKSNQLNSLAEGRRQKAEGRKHKETTNHYSNKRHDAA